MTITVGEIRGTIVPRGWKIVPFGIGRAVQEIAVVNTVRMFFDEDERI